MKNNISVLKSRYGSTDVVEEFLRYPFEAPIAYDYNYSGTYSKYSIVDKYYVDSLVKPHKKLISGGAEWNLSGLSMTFSVSDLYYTFAGEILSYSASYPGLVFDASESNPRIDAIVINEGNTLSIVKGVASANPARPVISESQILVQYAYIDASSTSIGSSESVYLNGGQWTVTPYQLSGIQSGSYNSEFTGDTYDTSTKCVELNTDFRTGVKFKKQSSGLDATKYGSLSMRFKFTDKVPDNKSIFAQIQGTANGASVYGNTLNLMSYGLQRDVVNTWQHIVVPTSKFGNNIATYDVLTLRLAGGASGSNTLWRTDSILFQKGINFDGYMGEPDATGGGGGIGGLSPTVGGGVIGPAETGDGVYTDGVFTDFTENTTIGTAVDRFNELLLALVPAPALILSDWSVNARSGGVNGRLSFGATNQTLDGTTYFPASAGNGASPVVAADGLWSASVKRMQIYPVGGADISGTLASNVTADSLGAYVANSFREATLGNLTLSVNGLIVSTASLSNPIANNNTTSNTVSGFILSAATQSKFQNGKPFETDNPLFISRTGTWLVKSNDTRLRNGYNYITVEHKSTSVNVFTRTLTRFDFIQDANTLGTSFSEFAITSYSLSGTKYLSGIQYYTGGTIQYDGTMSNLYRNTYSPDTNAIIFNDASTSGTGLTTPIVNVSGTDKSLLVSNDDEARNVRLSIDYGSGSSLSFPLITSGKRRLNDTIGISTSAKRTLQGTRTGGTSSISNVYIDNVVSSSTLLFEDFISETYRLKGETVGLSYSIVADVTGNAWDSSVSLTTGDANHNTGLMVYNDKLIYPSQALPTANFSTPGALVTNPNFANTNRNYSSATGTRTYIRYFRQVSPARSNFTMVIQGTSTTFVADTTPLTGNSVWVHLKLPTGTGGAGTGWLDCFPSFNQSTLTSTNYQSGGIYFGTYGASKTLGGNWGLSLGSGRSTQNSDGYVVLRITVPSTWTGSFDSISLTWV